MASLDIFDTQMTKNVCDVLAQTDWPGPTTRELNSVLEIISGPTLEEDQNKRDSLWRTLHNGQVAAATGSLLLRFINTTMSPGFMNADTARFDTLQLQLNECLVFHGFAINDKGRLATRSKADTVSEVAQVAGTLLSALKRRETHPEVLKYCSKELLSESLFHALTEASKSIPQRVRSMTGLGGDGAALYNQAFAIQGPLLVINAFADDSDLGEQKRLPKPPHRDSRTLPQSPSAPNPSW